MEERLHRVVAGIEEAIERGEIDGAGLFVVVRGERVLEWYGGQAAPGVGAGPDILWPLASISKVFTASTIMALVERGLLTLSMPIATVLDELDDEERRAITIRHLLTHTAGVPYEAPDIETLLRQRLPLDELLEVGLDQPLDFVPGTRVGYSDLGYGILALVAERVTGRAFATLVREFVIEPAGLTDTWFPLPDSDAVTSRLAHVVGGLGEGEPWAMYGAAYGLRLAHPAWGVVATLQDLVRFFSHFTPYAPGRLLSAASVAAMTRRQTPEAFGLPGWGYGFEVGGGYFGEVDLVSPRSFGHTGATGCAAWYDPEYDLLVAFVSNRHMNTGRQQFVRRIAAVLNGVAAAVT